MCNLFIHYLISCEAKYLWPNKFSFVTSSCLQFSYHKSELRKYLYARDVSTKRADLKVNALLKKRKCIAPHMSLFNVCWVLFRRQFVCRRYKKEKINCMILSGAFS